MEHVSTFPLVFITLLKLCAAEVPGSWYSANVINDGDFSPKPISEIFNSTKPPGAFSTTNPIIVLPSSTPLSVSPSALDTISSSYATSSFTSGDYYTSSTPSTPTVSLLSKSTEQIQLQPDPVEQRQPYLTNPLQILHQPIIPQQNPPPNYFLIYQQAPQTVQSIPPSAPQELSPQMNPSSPIQDLSTPIPTFSTFPPTQSFSTFQTSPSSTVQPELTSPQTTFSTSPATLSTFQSSPPTVSTFPTSPLTLSTLPPSPSTLSTFQPSSDSTFPPNLPTRQSRSTSPPTKVPTYRPATDNIHVPLDKFPTLRIRMLAPSGSIMNINVNPTEHTTTKRTTTTRRPTTRRSTTTKTRRTKRNRNSYDGCIKACEGMKAPICASPLAATPIDPDTLKGFPSICHMACNNSFRKNKYEMLVEGKCGRLRTRIHSVDSDSKLKKVELNKAQYTIVKEPQAVFEFSSLPH